MRERRRSFNKREYYRKRRYRRPPKLYSNKNWRSYYRIKKKFQKPRPSETVNGVLSGLWYAITWPFKRQKIKKAQLKSLDKGKVKEWWSEIGEMEEKGDFRAVAVESNKVFEYVLKHMNFEGENFAEKMYSARPRFSKGVFDSLWEARKSRNRIVHEAEHEINSSEVRNIKEKFKRGLKELGVL